MEFSQDTPQCMVCHKEPESAIVIAGHLLCEHCERRIVLSEANDSDYDELIDRMKLFWRGLAEAAASRD